ncbi:Gfo/Idh/MocA family protein [Sphingobacterium thalpophilum]|uniref:Gfo/Idh/MocA family oxidoreductase n=1 Tax=Sphingobacterium thalpophilum TaxID=259 RepID=A0A4U9W3H6_9SPHI|nr:MULTISPECIES: Gfo/Idh/MocA family oxidoreductase [Sphingobacterium]MCW8311684.1 Gfo/Idh/MocA family oxidoreductase [Sphingobacterium sp. InxBP1]VTR53230.1 Inositol 2-dehydrogenase [Sphingobacterium thalpophilum]
MENNSNKPSRRDFIKTAATAAAAFMIVPRHVLGGNGFTAPSDKLQIAGIGVGGKGFSDINAFHDSGKADLAFLCDVDDRRAAGALKRYPKAKYYKDYREMLDKEHKRIEAVSVSTPDHQHAIQALAAMQLGKHVYVQKPLTHDVWEARALTHAAKKYKVVTQMGNQGASNDGPRFVREWYEAGLIGDVHTVYCWTDRPVWPSGIPWPTGKAEIPKELDWDLWLGTAPYKEYVDKLVPFNWRGWWDYGTGALGDMGCHLLEVPFSTLGLTYVQDVQATVGSVYVDEFKRGYFPESCPPSSHATLTFPKTPRTNGPVTLHWMDGGIQPARPDELGPNEIFGDGGNGILLVGTKGKILADTYGQNARLLPTSRKDQVAQKYARVPGQESGHYAQWVEACQAGYGKKEVSSPFEIAGPLTEALLMANLAIRGADLRIDGKYPGRNLKLLWDNDNMRVTNFDHVNQFVKRNYRQGWEVKYNF